MPRLHSHLTELAALPIPSWSLTNLLASQLLLFPFLTPQQSHPTIAAAYATFITAQVIGGRELAHWPMSGCTQTYLKQEGLSVP